MQAWRLIQGPGSVCPARSFEAGEESLTGEEPGEEEEEGKVEKTVTRGSGMVGVSFLAWERDTDAVWIYADARDTYKPAALDFGPAVSRLRPLRGRTAAPAASVKPRGPPIRIPRGATKIRFVVE
jgi:hypothetical protein